MSQKSGLNKSIPEQCWGLLAPLLSYQRIGGIIWVTVAYTNQRCCPYGCIYKDNRDGGEFWCRRCGHSDHADCNAGANIEVAGLEKLGPKACSGQLKLRRDITLSVLPAYIGSTHVKGHLDVEGSCISSPVNHQAPTGEPRTAVLWRDV